MKSLKRIIPVVPAIAGALFCSSVAADWQEVYKFEDGMRIFVDKATVTRNGDIAEVVHLVRWAEPQQVDDNQAFRSTAVRTAYDCAGKHERYLSSISYADPMGEGEMILEDVQAAESWFSISEASMEDKLWAVACAAKELQS